MLVGRTDPTMEDLDLVFRDSGVNLKEMAEYKKNVEPVSLQHTIHEYPVKPMTVAPLFIPEIDEDGKLIMPTHTTPQSSEY